MVTYTVPKGDDITIKFEGASLTLDIQYSESGKSVLILRNEDDVIFFTETLNDEKEVA